MSVDAARGPVSVLELGPGRTPVSELLRDAWRSRDLIRALARKNFFVRYRRASLGIAWAGLLPLIQVLAMSVAFRYAIHIKTGTGAAYPVYIAAGNLGWNFFGTILGGASTAIVDGASLASRIYFPRLALPLIQVMASMYTFVISLVMLWGLAIVFGVGLSWKVVFVIPATIIMVLLSSMFVLVTSALHVYARDLRYVVAAALSAWFYVTPVVYPITFAAKNDALRYLLLANPVTGIVELFRYSIVGGSQWTWIAVGITCIWIAVLSVIAVALHTAFDRNFADLL